MDDPQPKLTAMEVREAGIGGWRQILGRIKAWFHTGDFATGLTLVNMIGKAAEAANHHPDITLTYADVIVALHSHDVHGITDRDIDLARHISRAAAELGVETDVSGLTQLELGLDTVAGQHLAPFYAALIGSELDRGEPVDTSGQVPTVWWQNPEQPDPQWHLPEQSFPERWHFDAWVPHDNAEHRLSAVLEAGGTLISDAAAPSYWVVEEADGNRSCICTPSGR